jgi:radical SAM superfamily enzyme YgiQ (UPF0313 family)
MEAAVQRDRPEVIAVSCVATEYDFCTRMASFIKGRWPEIKIVVGGPHVTLNPEQARSGPYDALCVGEGEYAMRDYVQALAQGIEPLSIPNLQLRTPTGWHITPPAPFLQDLDALPFADRELWLPHVLGPITRTSLLLGRGCPYNCTYCCNHALRTVATGRYVRFRSPTTIVEELEAMVQLLPDLEEVYLEVETVQADMEWFLLLCEQLCQFNARSKRVLRYGTNWRVTPSQQCDKAFGAMGRANFRFVNIGLESGSERIRREVLKRHYSNRDVFRAVRCARANGLTVCLYNLFGLPQETLRDFAKTVAVNRICRPEQHMTSIFYPYPGTALARSCAALAPSVPPRGRLERRHAAVASAAFPARAITQAFLWFDWLVYKKQKPVSQILPRVLLNWLSAHERLNYYFRGLLRFKLLRQLKRLIKR